MKLKEKMVNSMINGVSLKVNIDDYILNALKEDITSKMLQLMRLCQKKN